MLLSKLETSGCEFNRNGYWYSASEAKKHLITKLEYLERWSTVVSTEQFIELAASKSSVSGQPYLVRCQNAAPVSSAVWLSTRLQQMRTPGGAASSGPK